MKIISHELSKIKSILILLTVSILAAVPPARAYPNILLSSGDKAVLAPPSAGFSRQLETMRLPRVKFQARDSDKSFASEAAAADEADLTRALKEANLSDKKRTEILQNFLRERDKLTSLRTELSKWDAQGAWVPDENGVYSRLQPEPRPEGEALDASAMAEAPGEFVDYLQGSMAWFGGQTNDARSHWEALIHRPAADRHYRSTWAAYMLGRSWAQEDPETAVNYFQEVRLLAGRGFADRLGLASASFGDEARVRLSQKDYAGAIGLYLQQYASGADSADASLRFACHAALDDQGDLTALATNAGARHIMNAFIISRGGGNGEFEDTVETNRVRWLATVAETDVTDASSAEQLALAAYQAGQWSMAQDWIRRAPTTPTTQWLQAKILLRAGKVNQGLSLLERIVDLFPDKRLDEETNVVRGAGLETALYISSRWRSVRDQIQGEIGVLRLARRDYPGALNNLLHGGFWSDAAYVGERVLTLDELKQAVDASWPARTASDTNEVDPSDYRESIRHLLARRLARDGRFDEARAYYPSNYLAEFDEMVRNLDAATNPDAPEPQKIQAFTNAATIFRSNGMELLGTEVWPDWAGWSGTEEFNPLENRQATNAVITAASEDEIKRSEQGVDPAMRFHYRYQAVGLAWEAAKLMKDNTDEKARLLCTAGSWIKNLNAQSADYFYKALVRHCRKTAIGAQADRMRWFPVLDDKGQIIPWQPSPPTEINNPADPAGLCYVLNRGNTLRDVADAARRDHNVETTVALLLGANPGVNANRLKIGQHINVPVSPP